MLCQLQKLIIIEIVLLFAAVFLAENKDVCQDNRSILNLRPGSCEIEEYLIDGTNRSRYTQQINTVLNPFATFSNALVLGVSLFTATSILGDAAGDLEAILNDEILYEYAQLSQDLIGGAVYTAIRDFCSSMRRESNRELNVTFVIVHSTDYCFDNVGFDKIISMRNIALDAVFGIPCRNELRRAAPFLGYWNIPVLTVSSTLNNEILLNNSVSRVGILLKYLGFAFLEVVEEFNWGQVTLVSSSDNCVMPVRSILSALRTNQDIQVTYDQIASPITEEKILQYLQQFQQRGRILLFCFGNALEDRLMVQMLDRAGLLTEEYVYFTVDFSNGPLRSTPWGSTQGMTETEVNRLIQRYERVKLLSPGEITKNQDQSDLAKEIAERRARPPFNEASYLNTTTIERSIYSLYLYDAVWLYLNVVYRLMTDGFDYKNGQLVTERIQNVNFQGVSGRVQLDEDRDRVNIYEVWQLRPGDRTFSSFVTIDITAPEGRKFINTQQIYWYTSDGEPPNGEVPCDFFDISCSTVRRYLPYLVLPVLFSTPVVLCFFLCRKIKQQKTVENKTWKIDVKDIDFRNRSFGIQSFYGTTRRFSKGSQKSGKESQKSGKESQKSGKEVCEIKFNSSVSMVSTLVSEVRGRIYAPSAIYHKERFALKTLKKSTCRLTTEDITEIKNAISLQHQNINNLVGISIDAPFIYILTYYCSRGSLENVVDQESLQVNWHFRCSLILDLTNGLQYLHNSPIKYHGMLRSNCCLIDHRWTLKIGNCGLQRLRFRNVIKDIQVGGQTFKNQLYMAPELLRVADTEEPIFLGTPQADIYSFAILLQELVFKETPYFLNPLPPSAIIQRVKNKSDLEPPYRPDLPIIDDSNQLNVVKLMKDCWAEDPNDRPNIDRLKNDLTKKSYAGVSNIADQVIDALENRVRELEVMVNHRSDERRQEKNICRELLCTVMPQVMAQRLLHGDMKCLNPEKFKSVTVFCSEIVGFAQICSRIKPTQVEMLLNNINSLYEDNIREFNAFKVETIGDCYIIVSGCPVRNGKKHTAEIAKFALKILKRIKKTRIPGWPKASLSTRIGLHSGPCYAGVVGTSQPKYCVMGKTVSMAKALEESGSENMIHVSEKYHNLLSRIQHSYTLRSRGIIDLQKKGSHETFWLLES